MVSRQFYQSFRPMHSPVTRSVAAVRVTRLSIHPPRGPRTRGEATPPQARLYARNNISGEIPPNAQTPHLEPRAVSSPRPPSVLLSGEKVLLAPGPGSGPRGPATKGVMESRGQRGSGWRSPMSFGPSRAGENPMQIGNTQHFVPQRIVTR